MSTNVSFEPLFSIKLEHTYFDDAYCTALKVMPTPTCFAKLARLNCRFQPAPDGGQVFYGTRNGQVAVHDTSPDEEFSFLLAIKNQKFIEFTDLDTSFSPSTYCQYFSGENASGQDETELTGPSFLPVTTRDFHRSFPEKLSGKNLVLVGFHDGKAAWGDGAPKNAFSQLSLRFSDVDDGRYLLKLDDVTLADFYLTDIPKPQFFGVVNLFVDLAYARERYPTFQTSMKALKSRWRYIIHGQNPKIDLTKSTIVSTNGDEFEGPDQQMSRGKPVVVFQSEKPIALKDNPTKHHKFDLKLPVVKNTKPAPVALLHATTDETRLEASGENTAYWSTIHVYL